MPWFGGIISGGVVAALLNHRLILEKAVGTTDYTDNTDMEGFETQALFTRKVNRKAQTDCHNCFYPCYLCNPWLILLPDLGSQFANRCSPPGSLNCK